MLVDVFDDDGWVVVVLIVGVEYLYLDVCSEVDWDVVVIGVVECYGGFDVFVNNAVIDMVKRFDVIMFDEWNNLVVIN